MHLAITHLPVVLSFVGLILLAFSLARKYHPGVTVAFYILVAAGLFAIPAFFTGEGAEETAEHIPGIAESAIEKHESMASTSLWLIIATGLLALAGVVKVAGRHVFHTVKYPVLILAFIASGALGITAHLGGQIRHTEAGPGLAMQNAGDEDGIGKAEGEEKDDDD